MSSPPELHLWEHLCPGRSEQDIFTRSTCIYICTFLSFPHLAQCKFNGAERVNPSTNHLVETGRKENSKGQATKPQRIPIWHPFPLSEYECFPPGAGPKTGCPSPLRFQTPRQKANSRIGPRCFTRDEGTEDTAGDSTANIWCGNIVQLIPELLGHCQSMS